MAQPLLEKIPETMAKTLDARHDDSYGSKSNGATHQEVQQAVSVPPWLSDSSSAATTALIPSKNVGGGEQSFAISFLLSRSLPLNCLFHGSAHFEGSLVLRRFGEKIHFALLALVLRVRPCFNDGRDDSKTEVASGLDLGIVFPAFQKLFQRVITWWKAPERWDSAKFVYISRVPQSMLLEYDLDNRNKE
ncbi:hypothetical protein BDZ45DRAFT_749104 [Acephala macrosclerotiorum]|nr:hypothetical protein BDZ45DRAFT_749104 [Acephala macrosclerotiorum]